MRIPWAFEKDHALASLSILASSSSAILRTYSRMAGTNYFWPKWGESRRILGAAHVQLHCHLAGEISHLDFEPMASMARNLLHRSERGHRAISSSIRNWDQLISILGKVNAQRIGKELTVRSRYRIGQGEFPHGSLTGDGRLLAVRLYSSRGRDAEIGVIDIPIGEPRQHSSFQTCKTADGKLHICMDPSTSTLGLMTNTALSGRDVSQPASLLRLSCASLQRY